MPKSIRTIRLQRLQGQLGEVAYELTKVDLSGFQTKHRWKPPINAYRCDKCLRVCVDLAGVDRSEIELELAEDRLILRGNRTLPEPDDTHNPAMQVVAMEIDHGDFERVIEVPPGVDRRRIRAEQQNGMLWIYLPLHQH